jgi:hypothetical protein
VDDDLALADAARTLRGCAMETASRNLLKFL